MFLFYWKSAAITAMFSIALCPLHPFVRAVQYLLFVSHIKNINKSSEKNYTGALQYILNLDDFIESIMKGINYISLRTQKLFLKNTLHPSITRSLYQNH